MQNMLNYIIELKKDKHIVLGVAFEWGVRKGLDVFVRLAELLDGDKYKIVLIGTDDNVDKKIPSNIISIHRTQNQTELARYYSLADVFVTPTREDNYPTVNLEALACGTPVITFATGGSPEMLTQGTGIVVPVDNINRLKKEIVEVCDNKKCEDKDYIVDCAQCFNMKDKFAEYVKLYSRLIEE